MKLELFWALLVHFCILGFYYCGVGNFPSSFYLGHKLKLLIRPKSILPSTNSNPSHPPWLITKTSTTHLQYFVWLWAQRKPWHHCLRGLLPWFNLISDSNRKAGLWSWRLPFLLLFANCMSKELRRSKQTQSQSLTSQSDRGTLPQVRSRSQVSSGNSTPAWIPIPSPSVPLIVSSIMTKFDTMFPKSGKSLFWQRHCQIHGNAC